MAAERPTDGAAVLRRIQQALDRAGLTQDELAKRTGLQKSTISGWFRKGAVPDGRALALLPDALGVSGHWLLTNSGSSVPGGDQAMKRAEKAGAVAVLVELGATLATLRARYTEDADADVRKRAAAQLAAERNDAVRAHPRRRKRGGAS